MRKTIICMCKDMHNRNCPHRNGMDVNAIDWDRVAEMSLTHDTVR